MQESIIEAVVLAFTMGGIVGAAAALSLRSSRLWKHEADSELSYKTVPIKQQSRRRRR